MTLKDLHPIWKEALAVHETFRALGFHPDDIFLTRGPDGRLIVAIESAHYGCIVDPTTSGDAFAFKDKTREEIAREWNEASLLWNAGAESELQAIYRGSSVFATATHLVANMRMLGVRPPILADA